jgi:hypothetical protein
VSAVPPVIPTTPTRRSRSCLLWGLGGCSLIVVVAIAGAFIGGAALYHYYQQTGFNCLPSDFPAYPGTGPGAYNYELNGTVPGSSCNMVFQSHDSTSTVLDFYESRLGTGSWQITSSNRDVGQIIFSKVNTTNTKGTVQVLAKDGYTQITIQLYGF